VTGAADGLSARRLLGVYTRLRRFLHPRITYCLLL